MVLKHKKFLHFTFQGIAYKYNRLLCTFSKRVDVALQQLHGEGIRVYLYLDDLIVMAKSRKLAIFYTAKLVLHLTWSGFTINWKKITPQSCQQARYLGIVLDLVSMWAVLSDSRCMALQQAVLRQF